MSQRDVIQSHLEVLMARHLETDDLLVDKDGEIPVHCSSGRYMARVKDYGDSEPHIEVYSVMIEDIEADPGLFEAINALNRRVSHLRVFWVEDKVVVVSELVGSTADQADIDCVCTEIGNFVHNEGPRLTKTFGGTVAFPDEIEGEG
jgi:hypothetical protein